MVPARGKAKIATDLSIDLPPGTYGRVGMLQGSYVNTFFFYNDNLSVRIMLLFHMCSCKIKCSLASFH